MTSGHAGSSGHFVLDHRCNGLEGRYALMGPSSMGRPNSMALRPPSQPSRQSSPPLVAPHADKDQEVLVYA